MRFIYFCSSPNYVKIVGTSSMHIRDEKYVKTFVRKPKGRRKFKRPMHRWENNINLHVQETYVRVWIGFTCLSILSCGRNL
jgi:hypothetical protein